VTCDLREHRCDLVIQLEVAILEEETPDSPEVDGRKELLKVEVEDPPAVTMLPTVRNDRMLSLEAVCSPILEVPGSVDLVCAVLQ
jgi:hypothetical protein